MLLYMRNWVIVWTYLREIVVKKSLRCHKTDFNFHMNEVSWVINRSLFT